MPRAESAHQDTFCRDRLPVAELLPDLIFELPELQYPDRLNCAVELLDRVIEEHGPDRDCLLSPTERWSYRHTLQVASQIAHVLVAELGLIPGNRVMLRGPNNPWLVACWLAVLRAGGVVVATMPLLRAGELQAIHRIAELDLVLCDHRFRADLAAADLRAEDGTAVPALSFGGDDRADLTSRAAGQPTSFAPVDTAAEDVALLAFTSGTTGQPKATMHLHRDVLAVADTFSRHVLAPHAEDVFTGTPPIGFTFGLGGLVAFPLRVGASSLLIEKAGPAELADLIAEHHVSVCFTAPTAYRAILAAGKADRLASLRRAVSAGEHLPESTWRAFHEATGVKIIDGIGSTEMLHVFISAADDDIRPGATGRVVPGYQARVIDADGQPVPDGQLGRLAVRGPTGCRYLADERQRTYVQDGWNLTGDTYLRDSDGYFWFQARNDDMIISAGYNIAGPEVEEALLTYPGVSECAVIGRPDPARGQLVTAFVVLADGIAADAVTVRALQDHVKASIAPYKYPRVIEFVDALPRTATGKVQRSRLREQSRSLLQPQSRPPASVE